MTDSSLIKKQSNYGVVSIIMPSFNSSKYIGTAIVSVLNQTYPFWELIIIDDASTDNTVDVINTFNDYRIKVLENEINKGAAISRNRGLSAASGRFIAFLDSDDFWYPNKLQTQLDFMLKNNYDFTCTYCDYIDEDGKSLKMIDTCPKKITKTLLYLYNWIACQTVIYDSSKIGLIQIEDLKKRNDYALWLKAINYSNCYCLNQILASYRVRNNSISKDKLKNLIKSHYYLFHIGQKKNRFVSVVLTLTNMFFGCIRKVFYVKRGIKA